MDDADNQLMTTGQAAAYLGLREQTLRHLRCRGRGPQHVRRGGPGGQGQGGVHWYSREELDRFALERRRRATGGKLDA